MDAMNEERPLDPAILANAADRFLKYGIAGLATQGDTTDAEAARHLLAALWRWWGVDSFELEVAKLTREG